MINGCQMIDNNTSALVDDFYTTSHLIWSLILAVSLNIGGTSI